MTVPTQAVAGAARGGGGDAVGGRHRGATASMCSAVALVAMVVAAAPQGRGGGHRGDVGSKGLFRPDGLDPFGQAGA